MAEERIEIPVTPEIIEPKDGNLRRGSTGRTNTSSSGENTLPNYLRASTGSCHDFCKFGREHAFKAKEKRPLRKGLPVTVGECQKSQESATRIMKTKKPVVSPLASPDLKVQVLDTPKLVNHGTRLIKQAASPSAKNKDPVTKAVVTVKKNPISPASIAESVKKIDVIAKPAKKTDVIAKSAGVSKLKPLSAKSPSSPINPPRGLTLRKSNIGKLDENSGVTKVGLKIALVPSKVSASPKHTVTRVASLNARKYRSVKGPSPLKNQTKAKKSQTNLSNDEDNGVSNVDQKKVSVLPKVSLSPRKIVSKVASLNTRKIKCEKASFPLKNQSKVRKSQATLSNDEEVSEKILYVVESKPDNKSLGTDGDATLTGTSSPSSSASTLLSPSLSMKEDEEHAYSETTTLGEENDSASEYEEAENKSEKDTSNAETNRRSRWFENNHPDNEDPAHKLRFRRGKVINLQSDHNSPKRLKFRKGRVVGDNLNGKSDIRRKSFKKGQEVDGDATNSKSEKVVLRHQDGNGKKGSQGLFNNVIEETASKLAETRKSKVKALVGAFETVISLQESRSLTNTTT